MNLQVSGEPIKRILIRCDGSPEIGFGHLVRCLALADELHEQHGCEVHFAVLEGPQGVEQIQSKRYVVHQPGRAFSCSLDEGDWLRSLALQTNAQQLVLDIRTELSVEAVQAIRNMGVFIVSIDDGSDRRLAADLAFYPPVPQVERLSWSGFTGQRFVGWDWILLRPEFARHLQLLDRALLGKEAKKNSAVPPNILVSMGGSDPAGFTLKALKVLDEIQQAIRVVVVLGRGYMHEDALMKWLKVARKKYTISINLSDMTGVMAEADLALASFGVTAYELAALGVPSVLFCLTSDHAESAKALVAEGLAMSMGEYQHRDDASQYLENLINIKLEQIFYDKAGSPFRLIDGLATKRIAKMMCSIEEGLFRSA